MAKLNLNLDTWLKSRHATRTSCYKTVTIHAYKICYKCFGALSVLI